MYDRFDFSEIAGYTDTKIAMSDPRGECHEVVGDGMMMT